MEKKAWVVAVDMGYGHQRAAYPLKDIAYERILNANSDKLISPEEKKIWERARSFYEWISRATELPIIGDTLFQFFDKVQKIDLYYPRTPRTQPRYQERYLEKQIKKGLCKSLISYVQKRNIPFVTTFFTPAIAANYYKIPKIFCVVTDTDISRTWVPAHPESSKINYLAPCQHAVNRLLSYGVKHENIILTGFPLPKECIGKNSEITKKAMARRLINLDPSKSFLAPHIKSIKPEIPTLSLNKKPNPLTIAFVVGGAGAQKEIGADLIKSLKKKIQERKIRLILVAGTHLDIKNYFEENVVKEGLASHLQKEIIILAEISKKDYFAKFNQILNETDILWTKPSELSFYSALGIPIILSPPIGDQEGWNRKWLFEIGAGLDQEDPKFVSEWIDDWLADGRLARKAWEGYLNAPRMGTYNIEKVVFRQKLLYN